MTRRLFTQQRLPWTRKAKAAPPQPAAAQGNRPNNVRTLFSSQWSREIWEISSYNECHCHPRLRFFNVSFYFSFKTSFLLLKLSASLWAQQGVRDFILGCWTRTEPCRRAAAVYVVTDTTTPPAAAPPAQQRDSNLLGNNWKFCYTFIVVGDLVNGALDHSSKDLLLCKLLFRLLSNFLFKKGWEATAVVT